LVDRYAGHREVTEDGGGPFELASGAVVEHGPFCARLEFFDPQDEAGLLACFEELAAGSPTLTAEL